MTARPGVPALLPGAPASWLVVVAVLVVEGVLLAVLVALGAAVLGGGEVAGTPSPAPQAPAAP